MYASLAIGKELLPVGLIVATLAALIRIFARDRAAFKSGLPVGRLLRMFPVPYPRMIPPCLFVEINLPNRVPLLREQIRK